MNSTTPVSQNLTFIPFCSIIKKRIRCALIRWRVISQHWSFNHLGLAYKIFLIAFILTEWEREHSNHFVVLKGPKKVERMKYHSQQDNWAHCCKVLSITHSFWQAIWGRGTPLCNSGTNSYSCSVSDNTICWEVWFLKSSALHWFLQCFQGNESWGFFSWISDSHHNRRFWPSASVTD